MKPRAFILLILFALLAVSCQQRYWYRAVVWSHSKPNYPIKIKIINESPFFVSKRFEEQIQKACEQQLAKLGYIVTKKNPKYEFSLVVKVDSFYVRGIGHVGDFYRNSYAYSGKVLSIMFECFLLDQKNRGKVWSNENELYFFNMENRDLRRSKGLVRYMIRSAK